MKKIFFYINFPRTQNHQQAAASAWLTDKSSACELLISKFDIIISINIDSTPSPRHVTLLNFFLSLSLWSINSIHAVNHIYVLWACYLVGKCNWKNKCWDASVVLTVISNFSKIILTAIFEIQSTATNFTLLDAIFIFQIKTEFIDHCSGLINRNSREF